MFSSSAVKFNPHLFETIDVYQIVQDLTGEPMNDWNLPDMLQATGLPYDVRDPIDTTMFVMVRNMIEAAFYAGYLVGRDPDKLLLSNVGNPYGGINLSEGN